MKKITTPATTVGARLIKNNHLAIRVDCIITESTDLYMARLVDIANLIKNISLNIISKTVIISYDRHLTYANRHKIYLPNRRNTTITPISI
jgi:predicted nucleic-acid-binding protein